jgi:hypothetical protein
MKERLQRAFETAGWAGGCLVLLFVGLYQGLQQRINSVEALA